MPRPAPRAPLPGDGVQGRVGWSRAVGPGRAPSRVEPSPCRTELWFSASICARIASKWSLCSAETQKGAVRGGKYRRGKSWTRFEDTHLSLSKGPPAAGGAATAPSRTLSCQHPTLYSMHPCM